MKNKYITGALIYAICLAIFGLSSASAATPPDSCFAFNSGTGTITNYYDHEANNPANPACTREVDIPSTIGGVAVTAIGAAANYWDSATATSFANKNLTSVTIPDSVTIIGNHAFYDNQLTTVTLGNSVTTIGNYAFSSSQLTTVTLGNSVTSIGSDAFSYNQLIAVTIPNSVTSIGNYAFTNNRLTTVTIPNSVTTIGSYAFSNNRLTTVTIPNSVTTIGSYAFSGNQFTTVTIANPAATMQHSSFEYNPITSMTLGTTTYTAQSPTDYPACFAMSGSTVTDYRQASPLIARDNGVLCGTDVTIPDGVTTIGSYAFSGNQLTTVTLGSSVTSIGGSAFSKNRLTAVTIPNSVTVIAYDSFLMQNQYGGSIERDNGIGPYIWSSDPAEIQAAYEEIWYVQLYTEDPSNPNNLTDGVVSESDWWGGDENEDGEDDSFGGHLINPAAAEVSYKNASGTELQASLTSVGQLPNGVVSKPTTPTKARGSLTPGTQLPKKSKLPAKH